MPRATGSWARSRTSPGLSRGIPRRDHSEPGASPDRVQAGDGRRRYPGGVHGHRTAPPKTDNQLLQQAVAEYHPLHFQPADAFLAETTTFVALVKAGKVDQAKALPIRRPGRWEWIEPVASPSAISTPRSTGAPMSSTRG